MLSDLDGDKLAGIVFLTILAGSLLGSLASTGIGQNLRNAGVWVLLILGGIVLLFVDRLAPEPVHDDATQIPLGSRWPSA